VAVAGWIHRKQLDVIDYVREENCVLREQLGRRRLRLSDLQRRRLATKAKVLGRKVLGEVATLVTPETLLGWYRKLIARKYDGTQARGPGRPPTPQEICELVLRMARENPRWGYTRIQGALGHLGHEVGRNTVRRILEASGLDPAPQRGRRSSWTTFLKAHLEVLSAADFFSVELLTLKGLVRTMVLFVIDVASRKVEIAGVRVDPDGAWMAQIARNLTESENGFLRGKRYLIHDRDPLYTDAFAEILRSAGTRPVKLPARSPNLNAFAERFVLSIKSESLDRMIFTSEASLRRAIDAYLVHYHQERGHQGLQNRFIDPSHLDREAQGPVRCRERLGGMLKYYFRQAA
jgi:transposase InsO family protein